MYDADAHTAFYHELVQSLATSTAAVRRGWIDTILKNDIDLESLFDLIKADHKTATRFQWMLSEIGLTEPSKLLTFLPFLFSRFEQINPVYRTCFASFWHYAGVPAENEGAAVDLLFQWLRSAETTVSIKSRALWVLSNLAEKYPDLKNELTICLADLKDKYSADFDKRIDKIAKQHSQ